MAVTTYGLLVDVWPGYRIELIGGQAIDSWVQDTNEHGTVYHCMKNSKHFSVRLVDVRGKMTIALLHSEQLIC